MSGIDHQSIIRIWGIQTDKFDLLNLVETWISQLHSPISRAVQETKEPSIIFQLAVSVLFKLNSYTPHYLTAHNKSEKDWIKRNLFKV
jgi:hypothetical protein